MSLPFFILTRDSLLASKHYTRCIENLLECGWKSETEQASAAGNAVGIRQFSWRKADDYSDRVVYTSDFLPEQLGVVMISVPTQRFGVVQRAVEDVITFPGGIFGFELQMRWLLLGDREHGGLYWLQNVEQTDLSLSVVEPREFISDYSLCVRRSQLASVGNHTDPLTVLCVLTEYEGRLCLNLRNPIVINPATRVGCQVVASDDRSSQYVLSEQPAVTKKSA